jgi:hypothetical protein
MFGFVIAGLTGLLKTAGVAGAAAMGVCLTAGKGFVDVVSGRRSLSSVVLSIGLSSLIDFDFFDFDLEPDPFEIELEGKDGDEYCVRVDEVSEALVAEVLDHSFENLLRTTEISELPSGLSIAKPVLVDASGRRPKYEGVIVPKNSTPKKLFLPPSVAFVDDFQEVRIRSENLSGLKRKSDPLKLRRAKMARKRNRE